MDSGNYFKTLAASVRSGGAGETPSSNPTYTQVVPTRNTAVNFPLDWVRRGETIRTPNSRLSFGQSLQEMDKQ